MVDARRRLGSFFAAAAVPAAAGLCFRRALRLDRCGPHRFTLCRSALISFSSSHISLPSSLPFSSLILATTTGANAQRRRKRANRRDVLLSGRRAAGGVDVALAECHPGLGQITPRPFTRSLLSHPLFFINCRYSAACRSFFVGSNSLPATTASMPSARPVKISCAAAQWSIRSLTTACSFVRKSSTSVENDACTCVTTIDTTAAPMSRL